MTHVLQYGTQTINFKLIKTKRKTLGITVYPDKQVVVKVPVAKSEKEVHDKLRKKAGWITRQLKYFDSLPSFVKQRQFVSGETHKYLGKQYRLKIIKSDEKRVLMQGGYIRISLSDTGDKKQVKTLLNSWYKKHALKRFEIYLKECYSAVKKYNIPYPKLQIREMKTRWGSCGSSGKITLNLNLIKHSSLSIRYVIMHELCHLKHHNHNDDFYKLLKKVMPDWGKQKYKLNHTEI